MMLLLVLQQRDEARSGSNHRRNQLLGMETETKSERERRRRKGRERRRKSKQHHLNGRTIFATKSSGNSLQTN